MTIEELRRARLAAKLEAMGGIGGYAEAKRKAEMEAEAKVEESLFFDPPAEIELARNMLDPPPADESKDELISAAPPAPAPRKAKSHKEDLAAF